MFKKLFATAMLSACAFTTLAAAPSFNYIQGGYVTDLNSEDDFDGWEIKGSFELNNDFYVTGNYQNLGADIFSNNVDADLFSAGIGYKMMLSSNTAFFTELEYLHAKIDVQGYSSDSENGYQIGAGVRSMLTNALEVKAAAYYQDISDSDQYIKLGAAYQLNNSLSVYADIDTDFDDSQLMTGLRVTF